VGGLGKTLEIISILIPTIDTSWSTVQGNTAKTTALLTATATATALLPPGSGEGEVGLSLCLLEVAAVPTTLQKENLQMR
jgi:hypothetical protein